VKCMGSNNVEATDATLCTGLKPASSQSCTLGACPAINGHWSFPAFDCDANVDRSNFCGTWSITNAAVCTCDNTQRNKLLGCTGTTNAVCDPNTKPAPQAKYCYTWKCPGQCPGEGNKDCYRRVRSVAGNQACVDSNGVFSKCGGTGRIHFNVICNRPGASGQCSAAPPAGLRNWKPCNIHACPQVDDDDSSTD